MANFSGAVRIGDVNDFIAPSQACVLNLDGSVAEQPKVRRYRSCDELVDVQTAVTDGHHEGCEWVIWQHSANMLANEQCGAQAIVTAAQPNGKLRNKLIVAALYCLSDLRALRMRLSTVCAHQCAHQCARTSCMCAPQSAQAHITKHATLQAPIPPAASTQPPAPAAAGGWRQTTTDTATNAIKISLQDCLACSGCVTTAETMLLQHQSTDELLTQLADPSVTVVATLSHQSRASLAAAYGLGVAEVRPHLRCFRPCLDARYGVVVCVLRLSRQLHCPWSRGSQTRFLLAQCLCLFIFVSTGWHKLASLTHGRLRAGHRALGGLAQAARRGVRARSAPSAQLGAASHCARLHCAIPRRARPSDA